jgi:hypothetical protein
MMRWFDNLVIPSDDRHHVRQYHRLMTVSLPSGNFAPQLSSQGALWWFKGHWSGVVACRENFDSAMSVVEGTRCYMGVAAI